MMLTENIINDVVNGKLKPGWAIFRYNYKYALSRVIGRTFFIIVTSVMSGIFLYSWFTERKDVYIIYVIISVIPLLITLLMLFAVLFELMKSKGSMIVFTDNEIVKYFKGKYERYDYKDILNLRITNPYSADTPAISKRRNQYVDFICKNSNQQIELTRNTIFGPPEIIYNLLKNKTL